MDPVYENRIHHLNRGINLMLYSGHHDFYREGPDFVADPNFYYLTGCDLPNVLYIRFQGKEHLFFNFPSPLHYDVSGFIKALSKAFPWLFLKKKPTNKTSLNIAQGVPSSEPEEDSGGEVIVTHGGAGVKTPRAVSDISFSFHHPVVAPLSSLPLHPLFAQVQQDFISSEVPGWFYALQPLSELPKEVQSWFSPFVGGNERCLQKGSSDDLAVVPLDHQRLKEWCFENRIHKSPSEVARISVAAELTCRGIIETMKRCCTSVYEYQLANVFRSFVADKGVRRMAFSPICSSGTLNTVLRYDRNQQRIKKDRTLVIIDVGCQVRQYGCNVARTFPVGGKFELIEARVYKVCRVVHQLALNSVQPGARWEDIVQRVRLKMWQELNERLGLFDVKRSDAGGLSPDARINQTRIFMPHFLGHHIGLKVHDGKDDGEIRGALEPGMVIAVEVGIYFFPESTMGRSSLKENGINPTVYEDLRTVGGCRLKDTLVITTDYRDNLSALVPTDMASLEGIMENTGFHPGYPFEKTVLFSK